ncbi:MAG: HD domain-containing protein [Candidatus Lokiarchaeota archaeon]|nr:HD domain-containing protein [Candidatus Lokiarchaeota archaeon]
MDSLTKKIKVKLRKLEEGYLSKFATNSIDGVRRRPENDDIRPRFSRDADRILHSNAYRRYVDKTQVFYLIKNDHITHRVAHVQWVSKIARFIGRVLDLNRDLIEAISLGHDIGHCPFGHTGEEILNNLSLKFCDKHFKHNIQSVRALDKLEKHLHTEKNATGLNLTLQVLDGILCHNGEINEQILKPNRKKTFQTLDEEMRKLATTDDHFIIRPLTLEGCLVRFVDTISYIGRDIEDAIILNYIERKDLPAEVSSILGDNNRDIINSLVLDLIKNSEGRDEIRYSKKIGAALKKLKTFNYEKIYENQEIKKESEYRIIKNMFKKIFNYFLNKLKEKDTTSEVFKDHLNNIGPNYLENTAPEQIVIDYIAGMTDSYFIDIFQKISIPKTRRLP